MQQSWRWFGPADPVSLDDVRQAGAAGIVTALHDQPNGSVWPVEAIRERQELIECFPGRSHLSWAVVESVPVHESIKRGLPERDMYIDNYCRTLRNLAKCGIRTVCYNFMPVLDWTRTDLTFELTDGSRCLRYDRTDMAAFDLHILGRNGAQSDYDSKTLTEAERRYSGMSIREKERLARTVTAGLPGAEEGYSADEFRNTIEGYADIDADSYRRNFFYFLKAVVRVAAEEGIRMAVHPDDPPFPILGLPRILTTEMDLEACFNIVPEPANGITMCTGSFGARADNDVVGMVRRHGDRIHFVHLRNIRRDGAGLFRKDETSDLAGNSAETGAFVAGESFHEADHLDGDIDMVAVMDSLIDEEERRDSTGLTGAVIPMRPDHGHLMLDDLGKDARPGYSAIGRLRGLAELRGLETGLRALRQ